MNFLMFFFLALLAFLLSPGVLVSLPPGGSKKVVALTHAVVLAAVYALTHRMVMNVAKNM